MSKWYKCSVLIFIAALSLSGDSYGQESNEETVEVLKIRKEPLSAYWRETPPIRLCTSSGVTVQRLERALSFWRKLGYEFGRIIVDENSYTCATGGRSGEITILLFTQDVIDGVHIAVTRTKRNTTTNQIIQIQVYMNGYAAEKLLVLEHEIGHALGWNHRRDKYHLMNENWKSIGHRADGLSFRDYQYEILKMNTQ